MQTQFTQAFKVEKLDAGLRLVRGWAVVSMDSGKPYVDLHKDYIPQGPLLRAAIDFMKASRMSDDMHNEVSKGVVVESVVIDDEWVAAFGATLSKRGWAVGIQFPPDIFAKFESGAYTGFSIGGRLLKGEAMDDEECPECGEIECRCSGDREKSLSGGQKVGKTIKFQDFVVNFISAVDFPAQEPAQALMIVKAKNLQPDLESGRSQVMDPLKRIAALESLSPEQFAYFKGLPGADQDDYLTKSRDDRDALVAKALAADPVVHTSPDGTQYRKSVGETVLNLVKSNEALSKKLKEQGEFQKAQILKQRADAELGVMPGEDFAKVALLESIDKIENADVRKAAQAVLMAGVEAVKTLGKSTGVGGDKPGAGDPEMAPDVQKASAAYTAGVTEFAKAENITKSVAFAKFPKTEKGRALHAQLEAARAKASSRPTAN